MRKYNISFKEGDERRKIFSLLGGNQSSRRESERGEGERETVRQRQRELERQRYKEAQRAMEITRGGRVSFYIWEDTGTLSQTKYL